MRHRKNRRLALAYALIVAVELLATVLAGWAVARWAIPYAYAERGYWAVGGDIDGRRGAVRSLGHKPHVFWRCA